MLELWLLFAVVVVSSLSAMSVDARVRMASASPLYTSSDTTSCACSIAF